MAIAPVPLSVLDLATVSEGSTSREALRNTLLLIGLLVGGLLAWMRVR